MTPRVLFVVPNVPYPLVSGGHLRDWQLLSVLARRGVRPSLLYFGAGEQWAFAEDTPVHALVDRVLYGGARVERPDGSRWATATRKLAYVLGGRSEEHPFAHQYDAMHAGDEILRAAASTNADVVVLRGFWCHLAPRLRAAGLRVVANCPDANVRLAREMVRSVRSPLAKLGPLCNLAAVRRQERHLAACNEIWVPTNAERADVASYAGKAPVLTVPNVVDVAAYPDLAQEEPDGDGILFVAGFGYAPNANAARALVSTLFPAIRRRVPTARLFLVGRDLAPDVQRAAARQPGIEAPGWVEDVVPWYRRAAVVLLPVREGAGMLFKAVESLAVGKPTVGVPEAFRGIDVADEPAPFVAARAGAPLVEATVALLTDPMRARALGARARAFAAGRLSFEHAGRCLARSILAEAA